MDIIDETFIAVSPIRLAPIVKDPRNHSVWWPHLVTRLVCDRGAKGAQWEVTGQITGSLEIWLEPFWEGAVLHHYVRGVAHPEAPAGVSARHVARWKPAVTRLKDLLEDRAPSDDPAGGR